MKTYAYVTAECCEWVDAVLPGSTVGERPISRHGDYSAWRYGKRETLAMIRDQRTPLYQWKCARAVAKLRGWA